MSEIARTPATTAAPATFNAETFTARGTRRPAVRLPAELFDGTVNLPVMHQAVKAFLANQRQGNAATKIRKYVTGGNQKPWKQKGTGRARQGSIRAPQWVGGGTVFGPIPRSYAQYVPRQVRALARKSALNARAREDAVKVIECLRLRRAEHAPPASAPDDAWRGRPQGPDPRRRRPAEPVPQRPQSAIGAGDTVLQCVDLPYPLVGCGVDRSRGTRHAAGAIGW